MTEAEEFIPTAKVIAHSVSENGVEVVTVEGESHRLILAEQNTHRVLSRNSASSRAIPVFKQLDKVERLPAYPLSWPCEKPGMSGGSQLTGDDLEAARMVFALYRDDNVALIREYLDTLSQVYGIPWDTDDQDALDELKSHTLHKSLLNRLIEPVMRHTQIVTGAGSWENYYQQRCSPQAQPEMQVFAEAIRDAIAASTPTLLQPGEWHTPYVTDEEKDEWGIQKAKEVSTARCARVSYLTHDGIRDPQEDLNLYGRLASASPRHWSPLEHVCTPNPSNIANVFHADGSPAGQVPIIGNFLGYEQFRHEGKTWAAA